MNILNLKKIFVSIVLMDFILNIFCVCIDLTGYGLEKVLLSYRVDFYVILKII